MKITRIILFLIISMMVFTMACIASEPQEMPKVKKQVNPVYPDKMKQAGIEGEVWLKVTVDNTGKVAEVATEKATNKAFVPAATNAIKKWEFSPAMKDGKPVECTVVIPVKFKLGDKKKE